MSGVDRLPVGLTTRELAAVLREKSGQEVNVVDVDNVSGSTTGDHYLGEIVRLRIRYQSGKAEKTGTFILKYLSENGVPFLTLMQGTEKENIMYEEVLPKMTEMLRGDSLSPKMYRKHDNWLLMEDLCSLGYKSVDRMKLLDLEHALRAVEALARYHALGHHLYQLDALPDVVKVDNFNKPDNHEFIFGNFEFVDRIADALSECGGGKYVQRLRELKVDGRQKIKDALSLKQGFGTLIHGDYWVTNMLFKYNVEGKVIGTKIIDYQLVRYSTSGYDLHFFTATAIRPSVAEKHLDQIMSVYLDTLNSTLRLIGSKDQLSKEQFDEMLNDTRFIGVFIILSFLPVPLCDPSAPINFTPPPHLNEEQKKNYEPFSHVYSQKRYREHLLSMLDFFSSKGAI